jgi:hypothetical protein
MQKLYTLRGVSAVCVDINVTAGYSVSQRRSDTAAARGTGVYATARILNVNAHKRVVAFINTGLIQTPLYIRAAKKHGLRTFNR